MTESNRIWLLPRGTDPEMQTIETLLLECGERVEDARETPERFRVRRIAPSAFSPPCGCSHAHPITVWEGDDLSQYTGGLGAFDEGCHHPSRWVEYLVHGQWVRELPCVSTRNAYQASVIPALDGIRRDGGTLYCVECRVPALADPGVDCACEIRHLDHHRPGDPGFGKGPDDFLEASSLGQVIAELARLGALPEHWDWYHGIITAGRRGIWQLPDGTWMVALRDPKTGVWYSAPVPHHLVVIAACDHCLHHAWAGRCPGVTRADVREYRAAMASSRPVEPKSHSTYLADFDSTREILEGAASIQFGYSEPACCERPAMAPLGEGTCECSDCGARACEFTVVDTRSLGHLPELPDVACYLGIAYIAEVEDRDGRRKVVLGGATTPSAVEHFMKVWAPAQGLAGIYGDPARGFAGGYYECTR